METEHLTPEERLKMTREKRGLCSTIREPRFPGTDEGWNMALGLIDPLHPVKR